ncbi:hypothetical protein J19TS2_01790 [Cohnella xylanilytica]|nr:hypothetical protein J19TS2_01790 [Cohnella xylanilytica]
MRAIIPFAQCRFTGSRVTIPFVQDGRFMELRAAIPFAQYGAVSRGDGLGKK